MAKAWSAWAAAVAGGLHAGGALVALTDLSAPLVTTAVLSEGCAGRGSIAIDPSSPPARVVNLTLRDNGTFEVELPQSHFTMRMAARNASIASLEPGRAALGRTGRTDGFVSGGCNPGPAVERHVARGDGTLTIESWLSPEA